MGEWKELSRRHLPDVIHAGIMMSGLPYITSYDRIEQELMVESHSIRSTSLVQAECLHVGARSLERLRGQMWVPMFDVVHHATTHVYREVSGYLPQPSSHTVPYLRDGETMSRSGRVLSNTLCIPLCKDEVNLFYFAEIEHFAKHNGTPYSWITTEERSCFDVLPIETRHLVHWNSLLLGIAPMVALIIQAVHEHGE